MEEWVILFKKRVILHFTINEGQCLVIGRDNEADVIIPNTAVSRKHSTLELRDGQYYLADLLSMNGTRVNRKKIRSSTPISKMDRLNIGKFTLKPADDLSDEEKSEEAASVARNYAEEAGDRTVYVSGIFNETDLRKKKEANLNRQLTVLAGKASPARLLLHGQDVKAGKDPTCNLILSGFLMGKIQFSIVFRKKGYLISPGSGFRKTCLNGEKLMREKLLKPLDIITVGSVRIRFS
ncbi:MAG: FHA domain-containing protein [Proteobacteria bacterium]|nr:FHA domain-containing protein [Pseudomonadota bacterium]MBU1687358.1 FHA domain-containing protein [Pseudomonadota bacterium]